MLSVLVRRVLWSIPLVFVVSAISFLLESLVPGNAAEAILGSDATPSAVRQLNRELGLTKPLYDQYWQWLDRLFHGSLGASIENGESVTSLIASRLPATAALIGGAIVVTVVLGTVIGLFTAVRGGRVGKVVDLLAIPGLAIPSFWLGLLFIEVFAVKLSVFPATGFVDLSASPGGWARSLALPVLTLALSQVAVLAKQVRASVAEVLDAPFVVHLRAVGIRPRRIVVAHVLRNAAIPAVTVAGLLVVGSLTSAVVIEQVFVLPGLGSLAVTATGAHDIPVVQGVALVFTLIVVCVNLVVDLAYTWLNPKVRV